MTAWTQPLPYFSRKELACKGSGVIKLHPTFAATLPHLRVMFGEPMIPTSVCRNPEHNRYVGGHPRSLHLTENPEHPTEGCMAADIRWDEWEDGKKLWFAGMAWDLGWSVGLHNAFVHIDRRRDIGLRQNVFHYGAWWQGPFGVEDVKVYV